MLLSVIINTYERPVQLSRCLEHLARQKEAEPREIIVVDDGGRMDLKAIRRVWETRLPLRILRIPHAGRSAARNHGVRHAQGDRVLFLGDDVFVRPGCIARHRSVTDPRIAVVGPYPIRDLRGSPPFRRWAEPNPQNDIADPANAGFMHFATGNLSIDRGVFLDLGGFDERFTVYGWEDLDLGLRFERQGGRLIFDPEARADHHHPPFSRSHLWCREWEMGFTAYLFWRKWVEAAPEIAAGMKFWPDPAALRPGPNWRRSLGDFAIALFDGLAPGSKLNARLYERMIYAFRFAGVAAAFAESGEKEALDVRP